MTWRIFEENQVHLIRGLKAAGKESGQMMIMFALLLPLLFCFVGFGIDFGFAFLIKAQLAKACDAAALATMLSLGQGNTQATAIGQAKFALNANGNSQLYVSAPTPTINIVTVPGSEPIVNVLGTAKIHTFFIGFAGFPTLTITNYAQAIRPPIFMSMVLDRTGSMNGNGGKAALPGAVTDFLGYFIEGTDQLGEVSFAWSATNDVGITQTFKAPINNSLNTMNFADGTYSMSGLQSGFNQIPLPSALPTNAVPVVIFFTDGWDNTIQALLPSPSASNKVMVEFGGNAATTAGFDENDYLAFIDPNNVEQNSGNGFWGQNPAYPTTAGTCEAGGGNGYPSDRSMQNCNGANTFTPMGGSADPLGTSPVPINRINITTEAEYTAYQEAEQMRAQGITVYSIGLGDDIDTTFLQEVANDPASPYYNASEPQGVYVAAPTAADLDAAFQEVAAKILLRLTH
jgi:Flp pilus assembly protein TadG